MSDLVSIILSVYNGEKYLKAAIDSLLDQTYAPLEIIIIDDGSQDRTSQIIGEYGSLVRSFFQPNRGQPAAVNCGISMAKGRFIAFQDADDLHMREKTALQVDFLQQVPEIDCVFGLVEQFISPELSLEEKKRVCPEGLQKGYLAAAGLFRRECFEKMGLFNEEKKIGLFIDWYMRAEEKGLQSRLIPNLVLRRRIHESNMGITFKHSKMDYLHIVKEALKRRALA